MPTEGDGVASHVSTEDRASSRRALCVSPSTRPTTHPSQDGPLAAPDGLQLGAPGRFPTGRARAPISLPRGNAFTQRLLAPRPRLLSALLSPRPPRCPLVRPTVPLSALLSHRPPCCPVRGGSCPSRHRPGGDPAPEPRAGPGSWFAGGLGGPPLNEWRHQS